MRNDDSDERDRNGRWKKGHCPNPKGRPRKKTPISDSDVYFFKQTLIEAIIGGKPTLITRHGLLLHKRFEQAIKGNATAQRQLIDRFEKSDDTIAEAEFHLRFLGRKIVEHHDKTGMIDEALYGEYSPLYEMLRGRPHHEVVNEPKRRPRDRSKPAVPAASRRKGPQAILDLEAEPAAEEAAELDAKMKVKERKKRESPNDS